MTAPRILIVEDHLLVAESLGLQLIDCGYQVIGISSKAEDAVEQVRTQSPDLVLMDIMLAGAIDGIEAAQKIRDSCNIPVLYLTACADDAFLQRARVTEPYAYLLKPSTPREIQLTIEIALYRQRSESIAHTALEQAVAERTHKIEQTQLRITSILENTSDAFVALDTDWRYIYVNQKAGALFGRKPEELIGKHIWTEFPEGIGQPFYHAYHQAMKEQTPIQLEEYYPPWERWFENRIFPSKDALSIFFHDITERKKTEQALRESEEKFRKLTATVSAGIIIYRGNRFAYANPEAETIGGYSHDELLAMKWTDLVHPDDCELVMQRATARLAGEEQPRRYEMRILTKGGETRWLDLTAGLIEFEGAPAGLATLYDITARKQAEGEIRALNAELEQRVAERTADLAVSNQELEAFSYSVAHDLRAPLRAMQGFAQALAEDYGNSLDPSGREYIARIIAAAQRMDNLIQDLLSYSQLSRAEIQLQPVSLAAAVKAALIQIDGEIRKSGARITAGPFLPEVIGHAPTLIQIISNLLSNAIKFVPAGIQPRVRILTEERGKRMRLWIEDNGIGIAPEHQEHIFQVFERLHGVEAYPGTGIGLAIVNKGAVRMGGGVGVESETGKGSRFWVELEKSPTTGKP